MKYLLPFLFLTPFASLAQQNCTSAYIHVFSVTDSLPVAPVVQVKLDSAQEATAKGLAQKKKAYLIKYKDPKIVSNKLKQDKALDSANNLKLRRSLQQRFYVKQISAAQLKIYDKGKIYNSVMNADSPYFAKLPADSCDVTAECLKMIREMLK